jgi:hypothetical protein
MSYDNPILKAVAAVLLVAVAAGFAYYFMSLPPAGPAPGGPGNGTNSTVPSGHASLVLGKEINGVTFASILSGAKDLFIIMDVRGVNDSAVRTNILQCGTDFAGSSGLVGMNKTYYSLESEQGCVGAVAEGNETRFYNYTAGYCLGQAADGIAIYIHEANGTKYYTNAMSVGLGSNYTAGGCSIKYTVQN